jgi:hypothetical protein
MITGKNQPVLTARGVNQTVPGQVAAVNDVLAQNAEPFSEPAKHSVGCKFTSEAVESLVLVIESAGLCP